MIAPIIRYILTTKITIRVIESILSGDIKPTESRLWNILIFSILAQ